MLTFMEPNDSSEEIIEESTIANYFSADCEIAIEGLNELSEKAKESVKNIGTRIREFIAKVIAWIKGKFYNFLKIDSVSIPSDKWKSGNVILKKFAELDKKLDKTYMSQKVDTSGDSEDVKRKIQEKSKALYDMAAEIDTELKSISNSNDFTTFTNKDELSSSNVVVRTSTLNNMKSSFANQLNTLQGMAKRFDDMAKTATPLYTTAAAANNKVLSVYMRIVSGEMHVINLLMLYASKA